MAGPSARLAVPSATLRCTMDSSGGSASATPISTTVRSGCAGDPCDVRRESLQAAQAARRFCQLILTPMRLGLCLPIQRGDTAHDFLEAHFVRFVSVAILHARNPLALQAQKGSQ